MTEGVKTSIAASEDELIAFAGAVGVNRQMVDHGSDGSPQLVAGKWPHGQREASSGVDENAVQVDPLGGFEVRKTIGFDLSEFLEGEV